MKKAGTALISLIVVVFSAGWVTGANAQQYPPYQPTTNEWRSQSKAAPEERIGRLEQRVNALEDYLAELYNRSGSTVTQPAPQPGPGGALTTDTPPSNPMPVTGQTHVIQEGETLPAIAKKYGLTPDELIAANKLNRYQQIFAGDKLWIPPAKEPVHTQPTGGGSPPAPADWTASYHVQPGDTLHSIGRRTGLNPNEIAQRNRLPNLDAIKAGQVLMLPAGKAPVNTTPPAPRNPPAPPVTPTASQVQETYHYYDIVAGDTLSSIAKIFFTSDQELRQMNNLTGSQLKVGQRIIVPTRRYFENLKRQQQSPVS